MESECCGESEWESEAPLPCPSVLEGRGQGTGLRQGVAGRGRGLGEEGTYCRAEAGWQLVAGEGEVKGQ